MKKNRKKPKSKRPIAPSASSTANRRTKINRRDALRLAGMGGIGLTGLAGGGLWIAAGARAQAAEHDLSRIGQGVPAIVQVHDPSCTMCTALQRQTRRALRCDYAQSPIYLVADLRTDDGIQFSASTGARRVTLVLLDGGGEVQDILVGLRPRDELKTIFEAHFGVA